MEDCFEQTGFLGPGEQRVYSCVADSVKGAVCKATAVASTAKLGEFQFKTLKDCENSTCYTKRHHDSPIPGGGSKGKSKSLSTTTIVIIVVCSVIGAALLAVGGYYLFRPHKPKGSTPSALPAN